MTARRSLRIALSWSLGVLLWAFARDAAACSPPPYGWFAYGPDQVPANGVLPIQYFCEDDCDEAPDPQAFIVRSSSGDEVAGSVISTGAHDGTRYLIFKPERDAFAVGDILTPELAGATVFESVEVVPSVSWNATLPVAEEFEKADSVAGLEVCCTGPIDSCGGLPCFHTEFERTAVIHIRWGDGTSPEHDQYAFRILRPDGDPEPSWTYDSSSTSYELHHSEQTTCYTLELQRLVDGATISFDERCVDRPAAIVPGLHPATPASIRSTLSLCDEPPDDYVTAWCEGNSNDCFNPSSSYCATYREHCDVTGTAGAAGAGNSGGGFPGSGGSEPTAGSVADAGTPGDVDGDTRIVTTRGGCGCAVPATRPFDAAPLLALLVLGWLRARRKARPSMVRDFTK